MNIQINEASALSREELPGFVNTNVSNLMALTGGHLNGIIIGGEMVTVADWEGRTGLPYFSFSYSITFLEDDMVTLTECGPLDDIRTALPGSLVADKDGRPLVRDMEILHDDCGDIPAIFGFEPDEDGKLVCVKDTTQVKPLSGMYYKLMAKGEVVTVIAPDSWE